MLSIRFHGRRKQLTFRDAMTGFPRNDVKGMSAEIRTDDASVSNSE